MIIHDKMHIGHHSRTSSTMYPKTHLPPGLHIGKMIGRDVEAESHLNTQIQAPKHNWRCSQIMSRSLAEAPANFRNVLVAFEGLMTQTCNVTGLQWCSEPLPRNPRFPWNTV